MATFTLFTNLFLPGDHRLVKVDTNFSNSQPFNMSFRCERRQVPGGDPSQIVFTDERIKRLFQNAVEGNAHKDMAANKKGVCAHPRAERGDCGNKRLFSELAECRCEDLDRIANPYRRRYFENNIMIQILEHPKIRAVKGTSHKFEFNLAIFCSGRLLGEEILLFRLINELHKQRLAGTINLFLIDRDEYTPAIALCDPKTALARHPYLKEFLAELVECLPPSLQIKGTIYGQAAHYIDHAQKDPAFKHDLLIGADTEGAHKVMPSINQYASASRGQIPYVLERSAPQTGKPSFCAVDTTGELVDCKVVLPPCTPALEASSALCDPSLDPFNDSKAKKTMHPLAEAALVVGVVGLGIIGLYGIYKTMRQTSH